MSLEPQNAPGDAPGLKMYEELEQLEAESKQQEQAARIEAQRQVATGGVSEMLLERMTQVLEQLAQRQDAGPIPQIPISKAKFVTPFNPSGERYKEELKRPTFFNGRRLHELTLKPVEISLLNSLKAGKYNGRKWIVIETDGASEGSALHIFVPDKTQEQRLQLKSEARDLEELLNKILDEQTRPTLN